MKQIYFLLFSLISFNLSFGQTSVFINEIHYDNANSDVDEGFEIAGPAGTDLSSYTLTKYNGNGGASYGEVALSGTIPDLSNGYGVVWFGLPANGFQNGAPDGLALSSGGVLIQFLTYEGQITATDGVALNTTSTDIGVQETSSTPLGHSLQLSGSGTTYEDFTWSDPSANTNGNVNTGQSFGIVVDPTISISSPGNNATFYTNQVEVSLSVENFTVANGTGDGHIHYVLNQDQPVMKYDTNLFTLTGLSEGLNTLVVSLVDNNHDPLSPAVEATKNFTIDIPSQVSNINELRLSAEGEAIEVTGEMILTYQQSFRNAKVFQDNSAGIYIDDASGIITSSYNLGDGITGLTGTLSTYGGLLQFTPISDPGAASSTSNEVSPVTLTLSQLTSDAENYESQLVKVENITVTGDGGETTFINGKVYTLAQDASTFPMRTTFYNFSGEALPTSTFDLEGIITERSDIGLHLAPRAFSDVTLSIIKFNDTEIFVYPNPVKSNLNFLGLANSVQVSVYDMTGRLYFQKEVTNTLDVSSLKAGIYMVKIENESGSKVFNILKN